MLAGAKGSHVPAPIVLQDVEQSRVPSSVAKQIIFGAIGAVYEKEGVQVEVKELYPDSAKHRIVAIGAEILDRNGFFNETSTITQVKFKQCNNLEKLPGSFSNVENEPLECVARSKAQCSEHLKQKL